MECRYCQSKEVVKSGFRKNKKGKVQLYKCNSCGKVFSENTTFAKMKHKGEIITIVLDLYFKNVSLRKIQEHLQDIHGVKVTHVTIYNWIQKYSVILKKYADKVTEISGINNSPQLHADEMMIKVGGQYVWEWNVMDFETKFLTRNIISEVRNLPDAVKVFRETRSKLNYAPKTVVTDVYGAYPRAIRKSFFRVPGVKHKRVVKLSEKVSNNPIERFNGSMREVTRTRRGFCSIESTRKIMNGFVAYYNFIRPHMSLGCTPAEASGINLNLDDNRWLGMIDMAVNDIIPNSVPKRKKIKLKPKTYKWIVTVMMRTGKT